MTIASPIMYKVSLDREQSYNAPTFEINSVQINQLIADCPTVGKLFSKNGGIYTIPHSRSDLRTVVSEIDRIGQNYVSVKHDGKVDVVRKGPQL